MRRRKYLAAMRSLAAGGAAAMGTGAFSASKSDRSVSVNVVGDSGAYLSLRPTDERVSTDSGGALQIDLADSDNGADGLNPNSATYFSDLFTIENQGDNDVYVSVGKKADTVWADRNYTNSAGNVIVESYDGPDLLQDSDPNITGVFVFNEEGTSGGARGPGLAFGSGGVRMKADNNHVAVVGTTPGDRLRNSELTPGESVTVDISIFTEGNDTAGTFDTEIVVGAVEPGSDYDLTT